MNHLLVSYHTSPLEEPGENLAGGMNVLLKGFLQHTHWPTAVVTRSLSVYHETSLNSKVTLHALPCRARLPWVRETAYECLPAFKESLMAWLSERSDFDVVTAHYWMSAWLLSALDKPAGVMFHTLQAQKGSPQDSLEQVRLQTENQLAARYPCAFLHWHDLHNARQYYRDISAQVVRPGLDLPENPRRPAAGPPWTLGWAARQDPIKNFSLAESLVQPGERHLLVAGMPGQSRPGVEYLGPLSHAQMPDFYSQIHQLLNLSRYETFGLSLLEALAHGTQVGVLPDSDWARRLRRLGIHHRPGQIQVEPGSVGRELAQAYEWKRSLPSWEHWLQQILRKAGR